MTPYPVAGPRFQHSGHFFFPPVKSEASRGICDLHKIITHFAAVGEYFFRGSIFLLGGPGLDRKTKRRDVHSEPVSRCTLSAVWAVLTHFVHAALVDSREADAEAKFLIRSILISIRPKFFL